MSAKYFFVIFAALSWYLLSFFFLSVFCLSFTFPAKPQWPVGLWFPLGMSAALMSLLRRFHVLIANFLARAPN